MRISEIPLLRTPWGSGEVSCIQWNPSIVDTLGSWWSVLYTVEPLYCGHLGPGEVSCIQWNPSTVDTLGTLYTVEPLYCEHLGDLVKCPVYSGTPLLWTPWGPGEVPCIQWSPSIVDTLVTWWSALYFFMYDQGFLVWPEILIWPWIFVCVGTFIWPGKVVWLVNSSISVDFHMNGEFHMTSYFHVAREFCRLGAFCMTGDYHIT